MVHFDFIEFIQSNRMAHALSAQRRIKWEMIRAERLFERMRNAKKHWPSQPQNEAASASP